MVISQRTRVPHSCWCAPKCRPAVDEAPQVDGGEARGDGQQQVHDQQGRQQRAAAGRRKETCAPIPCCVSQAFAFTTSRTYNDDIHEGQEGVRQAHRGRRRRG